jgi:chemotaxis protein CheY-P-specific phosphatase CheC
VTERDKQQLEALSRLVEIGAKRAANALEQIVGGHIEARAPVVPDPTGSVLRESIRATGICFELEGCLEGIVAILFPASFCDLLARPMVGVDAATLDAQALESAVTEVGNILVSHLANAIADELGERLLPSIPSLVTGHAETELEGFLARAVGCDAPRIEIDLVDGANQPVGRVLLVPTR